MAVEKGLPEKEYQFVKIFKCDLSSHGSANDLCNFVLKEIPSLSLLINNAAIHGPIGHFYNNDIDEWHKVFQVNLFSPVLLSRMLAPFISKTSDCGSIINISGGGAAGVRECFSAYASSKTALVRFSEILAAESMGMKITVNCISPGPMRTELLSEILRFSPKDVASSELELARNIFDSPDEDQMGKVVKLILFLVGTSGKFITGKLISAKWDAWENWASHSRELIETDVFTLRRIIGADRNFLWGDR
jgi:3-oxoacyl-[acyl-carrier protein] reductase